MTLEKYLPLTTLLITHPSSLAHDMGLGHPERPDRALVVERALEHERFMMLHRERAPRATPEQILRVHPQSYLTMLIARAPQEGSEGFARLDEDTALGAHSLEAALRAAGGAVMAVDEVCAGHVKNAFVAQRPPGHHACATRAMGFCFFNNAAIAARHARDVHGVQRVAIVDFDVHHGNGTQDIFWDDASVLYCSTHEMPLYPGTGAPYEEGAHGQILNVAMQAGDGELKFRRAFDDKILPKLETFAPELVIISAGFDAHIRDPIGHLELTEADYFWVTKQLMLVAQKSAHGRVVSLLEGGYDLVGLARSAASHVEALMG